MMPVDRPEAHNTPGSGRFHVVDPAPETKPFNGVRIQEKDTGRRDKKGYGIKQ